MVKEYKLIAGPPDLANMKIISRLCPTMAIPKMLSEGLRLLAEALERGELKENDKP